MTDGNSLEKGGAALDRASRVRLFVFSEDSAYIGSAKKRRSLVYTDLPLASQTADLHPLQRPLCSPVVVLLLVTAPSLRCQGRSETRPHPRKIRKSFGRTRNLKRGMHACAETRQSRLLSATNSRFLSEMNCPGKRRHEQGRKAYVTAAGRHCCRRIWLRDAPSPHHTCMLSARLMTEASRLL